MVRGQDPALSTKATAVIFGVSEQAIRQWVKEIGFPRVGDGLYPLGACVQHMVKYWKDRATEREATNKSVADLRDIDTRIKLAKYDEIAGHLISRQEVVMATSAAYVRLGKFLDQQCLVIARDTGASPEAARVWRAVLDEARAGWKTDLSEYLDDAIAFLLAERDKATAAAAAENGTKKTRAGS